MKYLAPVQRQQNHNYRNYSAVNSKNPSPALRLKEWGFHFSKPFCSWQTEKKQSFSIWKMKKKKSLWKRQQSHVVPTQLCIEQQQEPDYWMRVQIFVCLQVLCFGKSVPSSTHSYSNNFSAEQRILHGKASLISWTNITLAMVTRSSTIFQIKSTHFFYKPPTYVC